MKKSLRIGDFENSVFLSRPFWTFFSKKKKILLHPHEKRMGWNFDFYPGFQPKIPTPNISAASVSKCKLCDCTSHTPSKMSSRTHFRTYKCLATQRLIWIEALTLDLIPKNEWAKLNFTYLSDCKLIDLIKSEIPCLIIQNDSSLEIAFI